MKNCFMSRVTETLLVMVVVRRVGVLRVGVAWERDVSMRENRGRI